MDCLCDAFEGIFGPKIEFATPVRFVQESEMAAIDAAFKLMMNSDKVVMDICNLEPNSIHGRHLSQGHLKRVDPKDKKYVEAMVRAACCRLLGKETSGASTKEEALVWEAAAKFLGLRIQGSAEEMPGRDPDMSAEQAAEMKTVLAQIEAASKLMSNRETIVKDIINTGTKGVYGGPLTQLGLKRLDPKYKDVVNDMIGEITSRLLGKKASIPSGDVQVQVWADAASFLGNRVQTSDSPDNDEPHEDRRSDMSKAASVALKAMLGQLEAAHRLMANRETVVKDIINPGPDAVLGGKITQTELKRVDSKYKASLDEMVNAVCSHLLGQKLSLPSKPEEALAWAQAATYLYGRIQAYAREMPGRAPDMSPHAAKAMRTSLAQIEASSKLMSNRETVVKDITNAGPGAVKGATLTQTELKRVDPSHRSKVDAMVGEVCNRLIGKTLSGPPDAVSAQVWGEAATFFSQRIQASESDMPGRDPDMSSAAAVAMRTVLATITTKKDDNILAASQKLATIAR